MGMLRANSWDERRRRVSPLLEFTFHKARPDDLLGLRLSSEPGLLPEIDQLDADGMGAAQQLQAHLLPRLAPLFLLLPVYYD